MTANMRIFTNVLATYGRSLYALIVGLFCARWVLLSLGEVDFGLLGIVGGLIAICATFNALLASATTRFFAVAMGEAQIQGAKAGLENCQSWFNVAVVAHTVLAAALTAVGYPVGAWAVENWLTIPPEKIADCIWVLRFSCLTTFVTMVNVPFSGMFIAKQEIAEQSLYSSLQTTFGFLIAGYMITHPGDWLIRYAALLSANTMLPEVVICIRACMKYRECRLDFAAMRNGARLWQMVRFALCQAITGLGFIVVNQGMNILVNKLFGPTLNASMSVASKVQVHATSLTGALSNAFRPAIATAWGNGDNEEMTRLAFRATRYALFCGQVLVVPLLVGIDRVLALWLKTPPPSASLICSLFLVAFVVDMLGCGHDLAINASGRIAGYQTCLGVTWVLSLPVAAILVSAQAGIASVGIAMIVVMAASSAVKVIFAHRIVGMRICQTVVENLKVILCGACCLGCGWAMRLSLPSECVWTMVSMGASGLLFLLAFFLFALPKGERKLVMARVRRGKGNA